MNGAELARREYDALRLDGVPHTAGLIGPGSEVLGLDDEMSHDHDWGGRLTVLTSATELVALVQRHLGGEPASARDWLSLTGQAVLEVTAGPLFHDDLGLGTVRARLAWYPDDVWRYVLASAWLQLGQELPLMGRAADRGDDLGSRVIAARLVGRAVHLGFLLERRWAPYPKWRGIAFSRLSGMPHAELRRALDADQDAVRDALQQLYDAQCAAGLSAPRPALVPFFDRPYRHPDPAIAAEVLAAVTDPEVRALPPGRGSVEQHTDDVHVLMDPAARRAVVAAYTG